MKVFYTKFYINHQQYFYCRKAVPHIDHMNAVILISITAAADV